MNRLAKEKSPYLLQHAHNPVDWHPWGEEAFAKARRENKPVFVSIGYSTCHWCHVMERESFESQEAAARLNRDFVAIKVDREERPDIDQVYMTFVQATTGSGGWPLNVFVTPEGRPFYGGTYFAPDRRYGRPGFGEVLEEIARVFKEQRGEVDQACAGYSKFLESRMQPVGVSSASVPGRQLLAASVWEAARSGFDARWGGWGGAPKFPMPFNLIFLLGHARWAREPEAGRMAIDTLFKMSRGGIRDVVGGGFHRYSVDRRWQVPHFEKMLYDQAGILDALTWAFRFSGEENLLKVAAEIVSYVERDLKAPNGAFYSAEDADSANPDDPAGPKTEGAFYLWREAELRALLSAGEFECVRRVYGIRVDGNIHEDPHGEFGGLNILSRGEGGEGSSAGDEEALRSALAKLSAARAKRPRPSRDTKVLADWNGLWIAALARYGAASGSLSAVHDAEAAAEFFWNQSRGDDGCFRKRWADGEWAVDGQLEDYAFLGRAFWTLAEVTGESKWLERAVAAAERAISEFWLESAGGFAMTRAGHDPFLPARPVEFGDGVIPSANGVMLELLIRLQKRLRRADWDAKIQTLLDRYAAIAGTGAMSCCAAAWAQNILNSPALDVTVRAKTDGGMIDPFIRVFYRRFLPEANFVIERSETASQGIVCLNQSCSVPRTQIESWTAELVRLG